MPKYYISLDHIVSFTLDKDSIGNSITVTQTTQTLILRKDTNWVIFGREISPIVDTFRKHLSK